MIASFKTQFFPPHYKTQKIWFSGLLFLSLLALQPASRAQQPPAAPKFRWPLTIGEYPALKGITSSFGESRTDHFHNGVDIAALGKAVHPAAPGEYLFSRRQQDDPYRPEPGPGNHVFLAHEGGWISGYYHLADLSPARSGPAGPNSVLGHTGNTGHSQGPHLHFFFISDRGAYVNPMQYLPQVTDENPPIIGQLMIKTPTGQTLVSHSRPENFRLTKYYPVLVKIIDPGLEKGSRRGVFKLSWKLNDGPTQKRTFSELTFENDHWRLEGGPTFDEVFGHDQYNLGKLEFHGGRNILVVTASDLRGNETSVTYDITVNKMF